jgi:hypothetical protein
VLLGLLAGCTAPPESASSVGKVWAVQAFVARHAAAAPNQNLAFGGWAPADLVTAPDAGLLFTPGRVQAEGFGLTVFPGVSEGAPLGFIISDIWENHPAPWVQPVYTPVTPDGRRAVFGADVVFPVGAASTFYSPWWDQRLVPVDGGVDSPSREFFRSAKEALDQPHHTNGVLLLCPIVSLGDGGLVTVAAALEPLSDGGAPEPVVRHPVTGTRLAAPGLARAWVDGTLIRYLRLGPNRGSSEGQQLIESPMYVFTVGSAPLLTAAVLPPGAASRGFVRRWDVPLPASAGIFVPADRPEWRDALLRRRPDAGVEPYVGTRADAGAGEFHEYGLRVARDKQCFDAPNFPAACTWLDSEARVLQLGTARESNVLLTIAVLGAQP